MFTNIHNSTLSFKKILFILFVLSTCYCLELDNIFVTAIIRHGARTSSSSVFGDEDIVAPLGRKNLTFVGQRQEYLLGAQLKIEYPEIFKDTPSNFDYELHSSPRPRCLSSAQSFLLGAYPPSTGLMIPKNFPQDLLLPTYSQKKLIPAPSVIPDNAALPHQTRVFPIQTNDPLNDFFFLTEGFETCKKAGKLRSDYRDKTESRCQDIRPTLEKLKKSSLEAEMITGQKEWNCQSLLILFDHIQSYYYLNQKYPDGVNEDFYKEIKRAFEFIYTKLDSSDATLRKFRTTKIMKRIVEAFEARVEEKDTKLKFLLFSGHDTTIFPYQLTYGMTTSECALDIYKNPNKPRKDKGCSSPPGFAASLVWNLAQDKTTKKYYVRALLNGKPIDFCEGEKLAGLEDYCPFETWKKKNLETLVYDDKSWEELCGKDFKDQSSGDTPDKSSEEPHMRIYQTLSFLFTILSITLSGLLLCFVSRFLDLKAISKERAYQAIGSSNTELQTEEGPGF